MPGRIEKVNDCNDVQQEFLTVVDYAHTPGALESVLSALTCALSGKIDLCVWLRWRS